MKKVLEGLKNGDWKTRLYIIGTTVLMLAGLGGIAVSFIVNSMWLFLAGVAAGIAAIVIVQKFSIVTEELDAKELMPETEAESETEAETAAESESETESETETDAEPEAEITEKDDRHRIEERKKTLESYDEKKLKQVFYKYKVKRDHKCIIIDSWKQHQVLQAPAYIWISRKKVHFLIVEKETREIEVPRTEFTTLLYHPGIVCRTKEEYPQFRT